MDRGGPIVCMHGNVPILAGIATFTSIIDWGSDRGQIVPEIFTDVSRYVDWIKLRMVLAFALFFITH